MCEVPKYPVLDPVYQETRAIRGAYNGLTIMIVIVVPLDDQSHNDL